MPFLQCEAQKPRHAMWIFGPIRTKIKQLSIYS